MSNSDKIILDLCGGTGSWSRPYVEAGYDVRLITLPDYDVLTYKPPKNVYGILAAPPCTEFSVAKGSKPRNYKEALKVVDACLKIIWSCNIEKKLKFWAMENPVGHLRQFLGRPEFTFKQWQFGEMKIKPTDIWGYFNNPKPTNKKHPDELLLFKKNRMNGRDFGNPKCPTEYKHLKLDRSAIRAITPPGFAKAFFKANK